MRYLARYFGGMTVEEPIDANDAAEAVKKAIEFISKLNNATGPERFVLKAITFVE